VIREIFPWDEYILQESRVEELAPGEVEDDLFLGIRVEVPVVADRLS
jgi:hypothetical protein